MLTVSLSCTVSEI